jgi:hypothetical protein
MNRINFSLVPVHEIYINPTFPYSLKFAPMVFFVAERNAMFKEEMSSDVIGVSIDPEKLALVHAIKYDDQSFSDCIFTDFSADLDTVSGIFNPFTRLLAYFNILNSKVELLTDQEGCYHCLELDHLEYFIKAMYLPDLSVKTKLIDKKLFVEFPDEPEVIIQVDSYNTFYSN